MPATNPTLLNDVVVAVVADRAVAYYNGCANSVEAYATIDLVALSGWHYYDGILNDTRVLFDALVDYLIDFDVDSWA